MRAGMRRSADRPKDICVLIPSCVLQFGFMMGKRDAIWLNPSDNLSIRFSSLSWANPGYFGVIAGGFSPEELAQCPV